VRRIRNLDGFRVEAVERYLQRAHWELFQDPAAYVRWPGLRMFGIQPPIEWDKHFELHKSRDAALAHLLEPGQPLWWVSVVSVDGHKIPVEASVKVSKRVAEHLRRRELSPRDFASFSAPALELYFLVHA